MGKFAAEAGHGVMLSSYVIEHHIAGVHSQDFRHNAAHRLRWMRSTRRSRPWGYAGQFFTMPIPIALAALALAPRLSMVAAVVIAIRFIAAYVVSWRVLRARIPWVMLPVEDVVGFCFWIAGFFGNTIQWRGRRYRVFPDGRFEQLT